MVIALIQNAIDMNMLNAMLIFLLLCVGGFVLRYRLYMLEAASFILGVLYNQNIVNYNMCSDKY